MDINAMITNFNTAVSDAASEAPEEMSQKKNSSVWMFPTSVMTGEI